MNNLFSSFNLISIISPSTQSQPGAHKSTHSHHAPAAEQCLTQAEHELREVSHYNFK